MRAALFRPSTARRILARTLGRGLETFRYGKQGALSLGHIELPSLPGPRWVEVEVVRAGICECDLAALAFAWSPSLEPFASFPAVPGHEVLARVRAVGSGVSRVEVGRRVVVDPLVSCQVRGYPEEEACPSCSRGRPATCERAGEEGVVEVGGEPLAPGSAVGSHRGLPGGWGERMVVHESQCVAVPGGVDDQAAVLVEPLSAALHAVLRAPAPEGEGPVLVLGRGPMALGVMWALRAVGFRGEVVAEAALGHDARLARTFGASSVVEPGLEARQALVETGARAYAPLEGPEEVYAGGGFPLVFITPGVGPGAGSVGRAVDYASAGGTVVLVECGCGTGSLGAWASKDGGGSGGSPSKPSVTLDPAVLAAREIRLLGSAGYGREAPAHVDVDMDGDGDVIHTFGLTLHLMEATGAPLADLVTHVFPLEQVHHALSAAANPRRSEAVRVALDPGE